MNFRSDRDIRALRPLKSFLDTTMHESHKKAILKKLEATFAIPSGIDSQPIDAYRIIGQQTIKIMLVEEVNNMIMEATTSYNYVIPWARELYEIWMNSHKMKQTAIEMVLSLRQRGISTGFYDPDTEPKPTTAEGESHGKDEGNSSS